VSWTVFSARRAHQGRARARPAGRAGRSHRL
jgi:hypothetical protein